MVNIGAFTFQFDQVEDRIRLVGNLDNGQPRIDFWLTRRLAKLLLDGGNELVQKTSRRVSESPSEFKDATAQFEHEQAKAVLEASNQPVPTSAETVPRLLHRVDFSFKGGRYRLRLFAHDNPDEVAAVSVLTYPELHQILHLIHTGCEILKWDIAEPFSAFAGNVSRLQ
ncbi:hypothetical protein GCM10011352_18020 [Marinobacterium zhoushanense]|uniref:Uncharacterized protein n=1 Tax=Marinobacterium zhoushanense TaxID=1679163 RepID=A0ABQ1KCL9_9GAMM|nr:hypothetical protein [Marinobacterium zhoushanense]GGB92355.1 hypothetical protein GCM10011352_18020 [Marinobacterium zhoushanense]